VVPVPITLVLDTSAAVEFSRGSIHVGEVLSEIADEQAVAVLPLACLVEAAHDAADMARLEILASHQAVIVLPAEPDRWRALAATYDVVGGQDAACAALTALDANAWILTRDPGRYAGLGDGLTIPIGDE
jgi:hypothetical protein